MTWYKFWKAGERYFDRFYTVGNTLMVLKIGGYLSLSWTAVFACLLTAFIGDVICGSIANGIEPHDLQPVSLKNNL